ncbi:hypothetical protein SAMN05661107_0473 [Maritimibacter sp. HL-12]|jgi:hypothetical protein|nr:hypothetical protein SAMN05661107_0473 [Maritimibacter sp. HL-12]
MFSAKKSAPRNGEMTDSLLWSRIRMAPLPATRDGREFHCALALASDLPLSEAREIEMEYRRFLYLAAITDAPRVVPPQIRRAWQMHAQSPEYALFCNGVVGKALPLDDATRMLGAARAYHETRAAYRAEFGQNPPRFYWPEGVRPRVPRWLVAHAVILGLSGMVAYAQGQPLILAGGIGLALGLYGLDLYFAHVSRKRSAFGDRLSDDLSHFLNQSQGH